MRDLLLHDQLLRRGIQINRASAAVEHSATDDGVPTTRVQLKSPKAQSTNNGEGETLEDALLDAMITMLVKLDGYAADEQRERAALEDATHNARRELNRLTGGYLSLAPGAEGAGVANVVSRRGEVYSNRAAQVCLHEGGDVSVALQAGLFDRFGLESLIGILEKIHTAMTASAGGDVTQQAALKDVFGELPDAAHDEPEGAE